MTLPEQPQRRRLRDATPAIPKNMQPAFQDYVLTHYRRFLLAINLIAAAAFYSYVFADAILIPDMAMTSLVVRTTLVAVGLVNILLVFRYSQNLLLLDLLMPVHDLICAVAWFELLKRSHSPDVPTFLYASVIFVLLCNLGVRVSFKGTLWLSLAISAVVIGNVALLHPGDPKALLVFVLVYLPVLFFSLFIAWTNITSVRRAFLADQEERWQQAQLYDLNQRLQALAITDALTRVGNRRAFDQHLSERWMLMEQVGQPFGLLLVDIDYFKPFNDHYGHQAGDRCLAEVARVMAGCVGQGELFRYGGEEFAILLPLEGQAGLDAVANRLVAVVRDLAIDHPHRPDGPGVLTVSVGAALSDSGAVRHAHDLFGVCDRLLYQAKQQGRDRACMALGPATGPKKHPDTLSQAPLTQPDLPS